MIDLNIAIARALGHEVIHDAIPEYDVDGNAMLDLDMEMNGRDWQKTVDIDVYGHTVVNYWKENDDVVHQVAGYGSQPKISALAAYEALTGKTWEEEQWSQDTKTE